MGSIHKKKIGLHNTSPMCVYKVKSYTYLMYACSLFVFQNYFKNRVRLAKDELFFEEENVDRRL